MAMSRATTRGDHGGGDVKGHLSLVMGVCRGNEVLMLKILAVHMQQKEDSVVYHVELDVENAVD